MLQYVACAVMSYYIIYMDYTLKTNFLCIEKPNAIHIDRLLTIMEPSPTTKSLTHVWIKLYTIYFP